MDIIKTNELLGHKSELIIRKAICPKKSLLLIITVKEVNKQLAGISKFIVKDKFDKIIYTGDHLQLAINKYNSI